MSWWASCARRRYYPQVNQGGVTEGKREQRNTGRVWAHVGQPFTEPHFDVVVVGAGRMGAACALYLRQLAPHLSLLLIEEGGLPNEEGATILAPGIWSAYDVPPGQEAAARFTRTQLELMGDIQLQPRPVYEYAVYEYAAESLPGFQTLSAETISQDLSGLLDPAQLLFVRVDTQALTYRPGSLALSAAQQAIKLGANLLLNTRVRLQLAAQGTPQLLLDRLTVTNTHQIVTHETRPLQAGMVLVAAGAAGPALIENGLGVHTRHARAYVQYPRLEVPSGPQTPVLRIRGTAQTGVRLTLRPQQEGFTLVPCIHHRDPHGYVPTGGHLTGVPTGLRRELLEDLVALMEPLPGLATSALHLGKSQSDIPGAWVSLPQGSPAGTPEWQEAAPQTYLLLGGPLADTLGLSTAYDLAKAIAERN